jgi:hypothetical protein
MTVETYLKLKEAIIQMGYERDITWIETLVPPQDPDIFWAEYAWVVLNSGMKSQIAEKIWHKVRPAVISGAGARSVFGHPGKAAAIDLVYRDRARLHAEYLALPAEKQLDWLRELPWIGPITCYHLAKNYAVDVCKPDRHLVRIAKEYGVTPDELCGKLAKETSSRVATVDMVIWRAANLELV